MCPVELIYIGKGVVHQWTRTQMGKMKEVVVRPSEVGDVGMAKMTEGKGSEQDKQQVRKMRYRRQRHR